MNRRNFIASLMAAAGGMAIDPERLLWVPGRKLISIPKPGIFSDPALDIVIDRYIELMIEEFFTDSLLVSKLREKGISRIVRASAYRLPFQRITAAPESDKP